MIKVPISEYLDTALLPTHYPCGTAPTGQHNAFTYLENGAAMFAEALNAGVSAASALLRISVDSDFSAFNSDFASFFSAFICCFAAFLRALYSALAIPSAWRFCISGSTE